ncbi:MAG: holo-ACP synthase [Thermodesulfobacteriota bacterium]
MYSTGIDIVYIPRVKEWVNDEVYLDRVLTRDEKGYILEKRYSHKHLATYLAAKEAVMKALGTGWDHGVGWKDIEVVSDENGRPAVKLYAKAKAFLGDRKALLSIANSGDVAVAISLLKGKAL